MAHSIAIYVYYLSVHTRHTIVAHTTCRYVPNAFTSIYRLRLNRSVCGVPRAHVADYHKTTQTHTHTALTRRHRCLFRNYRHTHTRTIRVCSQFDERLLRARRILAKNVRFKYQYHASQTNWRAIGGFSRAFSRDLWGDLWAFHEENDLKINGV